MQRPCSPSSDSVHLAVSGAEDSAVTWRRCGSLASLQTRAEAREETYSPQPLITPEAKTACLLGVPAESVTKDTVSTYGG